MCLCASVRVQNEHQVALFLAKADAARRAAAGGANAGAGRGDEEDDLSRVPDIEAYHSTVEYPRSTRQCTIVVDKSHDAVLVPMFGTLVPFHISTIKSVVKTEEGQKAFLRFNFYAPGQSAGKECAPSMRAALMRHPDSLYVRTLNFMSRDHHNMNNVVQIVKAMQKKLKTEREAEAQSSGLVEQAKLLVIKGSRIQRLQEMQMWPAITGHKTVGDVEVHSNGTCDASAE